MLFTVFWVQFVDIHELMGCHAAWRLMAPTEKMKKHKGIRLAIAGEMIENKRDASSTARDISTCG